MYLVQVWIENAIRSLDRTYHYLSDQYLPRGVRCSVSFGTRQRMAFVDSCEVCSKSMDELSCEFGYSLKKIISVLDEEPLLNEELFQLAFYMKKMTLATTISCFQTMLTNKKKVKGKPKTVVLESYVEVGDTSIPLTLRQTQALEWVQSQSSVLYSLLRKKYPSIAKTLVDKGVLLKKQRERLIPFSTTKEPKELQALSFLQQTALSSIEGKKGVHLLFGQTGSGKTEIYLHLAKKVLEQGKQVLILVPEIGLTPQMIERVSRVFQDQLGIYHSGLNDQERYEQSQLVAKNQIKVLVGTRSSIFLPFQNLGLIVMDEEQDSSYKQDVQPSYHCRDMAIWRARYHQCPLILGSATPSLESYARAKKEVYHFVPLEERFGQFLAEVEVVDMAQSIRKREGYILSKELKRAMQEVLNHGEQGILLLNKRGYHRLLRCQHCQEVLQCPHCDVALSYHADVKKMKCHSCGYEMNVPPVCPSCHQKTNFSSYGFGTQKLCEEIVATFPQAKVLRMDFDSTQRKNAHQQILEQFGQKQADFLVGTQMIAKGLDFPDVTLVGVINADEGLERSDYRSSETCFDLLMQAAGRSGRGKKKGRVLFQAYHPDHFAIQLAKKQEYDPFFLREMHYRHLANYPPYSSFISFVYEGKNEEKTFEKALQLERRLKTKVETRGVATLLKRKDLYRFRILVRGKCLEELLTHCEELLKQDISIDGLKVDVNPLYLE